MQTATTNTQMETTDPREFIRLLMENERRIYAYIRTLLGNPTDAEDVLQESSIVMWDKFSEFDQASGNFIAWSFKIAYFTAQNFRRKQGRSRVVFSNSLVEDIANKSTEMVPKLDKRHEFLALCIEKLSQQDRRLLRLRFEFDASVEKTAEQSGRTTHAIYKALQRMRSALHECINRKMSLEGQS
jgi:RNA polymerase sigma-70 factor (ECF subfamily)